MGSVFKKQTTAWKVGGKKVPAGTPGAVRVTTKSAKWYGTVNGKQVPLCRDRQAADRMLKKLEADAALADVGLVDPFATEKRNPLTQHLADFEAHLHAKGNCPRHVATVMSRLRVVMDGCGWRWLSDLASGQAENWLTTTRGTKAAQLPFEPAGYLPRDAADLLGITTSGLGKIIRRHGLSAGTGEGKRRRVPRDTVQSLLNAAARGTGPQTRNYIRKHLTHFGRWLIRDRKAAANPFAHLELERVESDVRHRRRAATTEELNRLIGTARTSEKTFRGLDGRDRAMLYAVAFTTGFRAAALASLTPDHFDLQSNPPTVSLAAKKNKSRKPMVNPLTGELAESLRTYLAGKPRGVVWPGTWFERAAEMVRSDLEEAGIAYAERDADGLLFLDFHAAGRLSCLTHAARAGVPLPVVQKLAGHASPVTTSRYTHASPDDLRAAVERLPRVCPTESAPPVCTQFARTPCLSGQAEATRVNNTPGEQQEGTTTEPLLSQGFVTVSQLKSPRVGSEGAGTRTQDPQIKSLLLYQLSYASAGEPHTAILRAAPRAARPPAVAAGVLLEVS